MSNFLKFSLKFEALVSKWVSFFGRIWYKNGSSFQVSVVRPLLIYYLYKSVTRLHWTCKICRVNYIGFRKFFLQTKVRPWLILRQFIFKNLSRNINLLAIFACLSCLTCSSAPTQYGRRSFSVAASELWNRLPLPLVMPGLHVKNSKAILQFK